MSRVYNGVVKIEDQLEPKIIESYFELRQSFEANWADRWEGLSNVLAARTVPILRDYGIVLSDFAFQESPKSLADVGLTISLRPLNAIIRIGLESVTYGASDPSWRESEHLLEIFGLVSKNITDALQAQPALQESLLSFHVLPGKLDFSESSKSLVRTDLLGEGEFFGLTRHRKDGSLTIDKSLKYRSAAFVSLRRELHGRATFADVAALIYKDEIEALAFLGIAEIP